MLRDIASSAIVAVGDLPRARAFYADVLELPIVEESGEVIVFATGSTRLVVYRSDAAGGNRANAVVWGCGDEIHAIVAALERKGVTFEHYPAMEGLTLEGNVHVAGGATLVWLKDPDGNILHLNSF
ncbi:VOC family protein [Sphingomonas profundi]|uniref:VOC family protein n=1 Tax=Alterirhizorhabdus profundi TaxID=2681549 RepID=UPI0012E84A48|nr:VOC family protein [Sphingomonas profundi]